MNSFFLTGMGRSGTTLVEKLLCNHHELSMLSQPFPFLFVELKKIFLKKRGINKHYVLNETLNDNNYEMEEFNNFLESFQITKKKINTLFKLMKNYSGQLTKINKIDIDIGSKNFIDLYRLLVENLSYTRGAYLYGSKEILCEEFLPYMTNNKIKAIIIVRDPRDVLSSINYPKEKKYLGVKKPSLFLLKTWRKSVDFIQYLNKNKIFHFLKYEDLVNNPYEELNRITNFLNIERFDENYFSKGILDQNKQLWSANSSYDNATCFISQKSAGAYKNILSKNEIAYTEAVCKSEMSWLGYDFEVDNLNQIEIIKSFKDYGVENHHHLSAGFSSQKNNIDIEIKRIKNIKNEN